MDKQQKFCVFILLIIGLSFAGTNAWNCPRSSCTDTFGQVWIGAAGPSQSYCTGELAITPPLPRTFSKCGIEEISCKVWKNARGDNHQTDRVRVDGTCCWKVTSRSGETEVFKPGQDKQPRVAYFEKIATIPCPT